MFVCPLFLIVQLKTNKHSNKCPIMFYTNTQTYTHTHLSYFLIAFPFSARAKCELKQKGRKKQLKTKQMSVCVRSRVCVKDYWPHFGEDFWPHYGLCLLLMGNEYNEHNTVSYAATTDPYICPYEINSLPRPYRESMI